MPDVMRRLHQKFRMSPAPNLRGFVTALERGLKMFGLRGFVAGLYLDSATEDALVEWADAYQIDVTNLTDAQAREKLKRDALIRNRTTEAAIEEAILARTGVAAALRPSLVHVAAYDDSERAQLGYRMADYYTARTERVGITWGGKWGQAWPGVVHTIHEDDPTHLGYRGLTPRRAGYGPEGMVVYLARPYDAAIEAETLSVLADQAPAMSSYVLFWSHAFARTVDDALTFADREMLHHWHGWGLSPWGRRWGTPTVDAPNPPT